LGVFQNVTHFEGPEAAKKAFQDAKLDFPRLRATHAANKEFVEAIALLELDLYPSQAA
jgi:hypothetical protein